MVFSGTATADEDAKGEEALSFALVATKGEETATQTLTIALTADDDAPTVTDASLDFTLAEDAAIFGKIEELAPLFSDPEGDELSFAFVGTEAQSDDQEARAMGVTATIGEDNKITLSGKPDNLLDDTVVTFSVTANDGTSDSAARTIEVTITAEDDPLETIDRLFIFQEGKPVPSGATVILKDLFVDADTDLSSRAITPLTSTYLDEQGDHGVSFTSSGGTLTIAGTVEELTGNQTLTVLVTLAGVDAVGETPAIEAETATITVRIRGDDDAPILLQETVELRAALADATKSIAKRLPDPIDLSKYFEDPEHKADPTGVAAPTYTLSASTVLGVSFTINNGMLEAVAASEPTAANPGTVFTITATDAGGKSTELVATLVVDEAGAFGPAATVKSITTLDPLMLTDLFTGVDSSTDYTMREAGRDGVLGTSDDVSSTSLTDKEVTATITPSELRLTGSVVPADKGDVVHNFRVVATNGKGTAEEKAVTTTIVLTLDAPNDAPTVKSVADSAKVTMIAEDTDADDTAADLKFDLTDFFADVDTKDATAGLTYVITEATSTGSDSVADALTVTGGNRVIAHGVTATIVDSTLDLKGTASNLLAPETLLITMTASDGTASTTGNVIFTVTITADDDAPLPKPGVAASAKAVTIAETESPDSADNNTGFDLGDFFVDPEGQDLSYKLTAVAEEDRHGLSFSINDSDRLVIGGTAADLTETTTISLTVVANDGKANSAEVVFSVVIDADNDVPVPTPGVAASAKLVTIAETESPQSADGNTGFALGGFFTDPEGKDLSYAITNPTSGSIFEAHGLKAEISGGRLAISGEAANLAADATIEVTVTASDGDITEQFARRTRRRWFSRWSSMRIMTRRLCHAGNT